MTQHAVGQYHATMSTGGRNRHYELFKCGLQRVMVATSAFGLGIDIPDIREVIIFGLPKTGSEFVQLSGCGGRDLSNSCLVRLIVRDADMKECDRGLQKLVAGNLCLRYTIIRNILESDEIIETRDLCCSVCNGTTRPRIFYAEMTPSSSLSVVSVPVRTRRVLAAQKESLRRALVQFKQSIKGSGLV